MKSRIYTVTLNPAIDQMIYLREFVPDITNRLTGTKECVGGKGTHVSQNLNLLGVENTALGIVHGERGIKIMDMLKADGIEIDFQYNEKGNTRINYLLIEATGKCTCLSDKGVQLTEEDIQKFTDHLKEKLEENDFLILSGDASNCPDPYVYNKIIQSLFGKQIRIFLDASGETLKKCVEEHPYMIKPNQDELEYLTGIMIQTEEDLREAVKALDRYEIPVVAVSLGKKGSLVRIEEKFYRVYPPEINVCNTIGCGDCFLSGLIYGIVNELSAEEMLRVATAASAATAESNLSVGFDRKRFTELKSQVRVEQEKR